MKSSAFQRRHKRKPARNEHCLQRAVVRWCDGLGRRIVQGRFFAIPNGGARDIVTAAKLKAEGVRAGAPDLVFYGPSGCLWIEMKNGTSGTVSASQKAMHESLRGNGHRIEVCRDLAETIEAITRFYS